MERLRLTLSPDTDGRILRSPGMLQFTQRAIPVAAEVGRATPSPSAGMLRSSQRPGTPSPGQRWHPLRRLSRKAAPSLRNAAFHAAGNSRCSRSWGGNALTVGWGDTSSPETRTTCLAGTMQAACLRRGGIPRPHTVRTPGWNARKTAKRARLSTCHQTTRHSSGNGRRKPIGKQVRTLH